MSHYDVFGNETERLISKLYATYIQFYKIKQDFVKKREAFVKVLSEQKGDVVVQIVNTEEEKKESVIVKEDDVEEKKETKSSSLFHKVALVTHPDKNPSCNPVYFQQAQKANEQGKFAKLVFLSRYLKVETPTHFTEEEVETLQKAIANKEKKIEHYQKTYPWLYASA